MARSINGRELKEMLLSASNNLYNHYPEIDALNVFPVPDGDTGMNMNLTLASGAKEIQNRNDDDAYTIVNAFSRGLLMGARGNSGVITSQIFRGFASSLKDKSVVKVQDFIDAMANGATVAYKAVMRPVEGTILTVIREASEALSDKADKLSTLEDTLDFFLKEARASLKRTPELLPVLKEVGVVDSGGAGLVRIIEGMTLSIHGKFVEKKEATSVSAPKEASVAHADSDELGYRVEFGLALGPVESKKPFIESRFKTFLESRGSDIMIAKEGEIIKVCIISQTPGAILTFAQSYGEFVNIKIVNLSEKVLVKEAEAPKKEEKHEPSKDFGLVAISAGKGVDEIFRELGVDEIVSGGQTMNPSIEDIVGAIRKTDAKDVFVFPNNSNIVMAALQASDVLADEVKVHVVVTRTIPQGIVAASAFSPDISADENYKNMKEEIKRIQSGSITYAIKDTIIDGVEVTKDYYMGIKDKKIVVCEKNLLNALYKLLAQMINDETFLVTILIGEGVEEKQEKALTEKLKKKYENVEFDIRHGDQPVYSFLIGVE